MTSNPGFPSATNHRARSRAPRRLVPVALAPVALALVAVALVAVAVAVAIVLAIAAGLTVTVGSHTWRTTADGTTGLGRTPDRADLTSDDGLVADDRGVGLGVPLAAVTRLDPDLRAALRRAADEAANDGVRVRIGSGWRSPRYQAVLLAEAVEEYGSIDEAARWVATPETSPHVSGQAVDIAGWDGIDWLTRNGEALDLCPVYANEPWHYERRPGASLDGCPALYPDPTQDPRLRP